MATCNHMGGFETITKTLLKQERRGLNSETIEDIIHKSDLPNYSLLLSPNTKRASLDMWLKKPAPIGKKSALAGFLSLEGGDEKIIQQWLVQSSSICTWFDAVRLAKALRNTTSHGALSATKVKQWGLEDALLTLSNNLGEIVVASLKKLT